MSKHEKLVEYTARALILMTVEQFRLTSQFSSSYYFKHKISHLDLKTKSNYVLGMNLVKRHFPRPRRLTVINRMHSS
jgi:hypothetical protein